MKILITGATSGIGEQSAYALAKRGHNVLLHGRTQAKLDAVAKNIGPDVETYAADLSSLDAVEAMATAILERHDHIDVLINNAGIFKTRSPRLPDGQDVRFVVNTVAPYLLFRRLETCFGPGDRVVNLSSAAQNAVDLSALEHGAHLADFDAYAQSKLAITMWSCEIGRSIGASGPVVVAVNPGSMLGTKMVKEGFGSAGKDVGIGVDILVRAATSTEFASAQGRYFDNDRGAFANPHPDALDRAACQRVLAVLNQRIEEHV